MKTKNKKRTSSLLQRWAADDSPCIIGDQKVSSVAKSFSDIMKFNPYHDKLGRFTGPGGYTSFTYKPGASRAHDLAIEREKQRHASMAGGGSAAGHGKEEQKEPSLPSVKASRDKDGHISEDGKSLDFEHAAAIVKNELGCSDKEAREYTNTVQNYCGEGYRQIRRYQQGRQQDAEVHEAAKRSSDNIERYIEKAPSYNGKIYRGITLEDGDPKKVFKKGTSVSMNGTSSWSSSDSVAQSFGNAFYHGTSNVVFVSNSPKKSTSIQHLSEFGKDEKEVLVSKDVKYIAKRVSKKGNIYYVYLDEAVSKSAGEDGKYVLFIGLNVDGNKLKSLHIPGGEDPKDYHITLLYGYFDPNGNDEDSITVLVQSSIEDIKPYVPDTVELDAIDYFTPSKSSDGKYPVYARVAEGQLEQLHKDLIRSLKKNGIKIEQTFPEYNPHITLAYVDEQAAEMKRTINETAPIKNIIIGTGKDEVEEKKNTFTIAKTDDEKRLVFGWANVAIRTDGEQIQDLQNDIVDPEDLEEAVYEYVLNFRDGGEEHISGLRKKAKMVESVMFTEEKLKAMGIPAGTVPLGWWIGFYVKDDEAWEKVKDGTYTMFSVEGSGKRQPINKSSSYDEEHQKMKKLLEGKKKRKLA